MADDRPVEDPTQMVARLATDLDDLKSTVLSRLTRRPTGDVEPTIRSTPKPGTLLLQGQIVSRATYPALWAWVQEQGLLMVGLFGPADGLTTFGLPNFAGRVPLGVGTLGTDVYALGNLVGAASRTLVTANVPSHSHTVSDDGSHSHSGSANSGGEHQGHNDASGTQPGGTGWPYGREPAGNHSHSLSINSAGGHDHAISGPSGTVTPFDNRQASIAINWAIWT